ncbi:MAG: 4-hydroxythreonine-4-phosphate dehydrogenase PdxA [Candidatus Aminicenantes bacterium]
MIPPKIGITLGDPGGIGPEIILKALTSIESFPPAHHIIFGSTLILEEEKEKLGIKLEIPRLQKKSLDSLPHLSVWEVNSPLKTVKRGSPSPANGRASFSYFQKAVEQARKGTIQALVTAPVSKKSWEMAGLKWSGHTHYLSRFYPRAIMTFWSEKLKVALFTHHLPLKRAVNKIKKEALLDFFLQLDQNLKNIHSPSFHLLVAGLNPHAGEGGLLGSEEEKDIVPAIKKAQKKGVDIRGPFPPDTVFRCALNQPDKMAIALYHDQGLIPFKLESFHQGVNLTLGLPFIRTSPDHGTAFDIAGKGKANPQSMIQALKLASMLLSSP